MSETWRSVVNYEGRYEVSDRGRVRSLLGRRKRILRSFLNDEGYRKVHLTAADGRERNHFVHKLVLIAFVGPPPDPRMQGLHRNNRRRDARLENLRWGTHADNHADKIAAGTAGNGGRARGKLDRRKVSAIRRSKKSARVIAARYGTALSTIRDVRNGRRWA